MFKLCPICGGLTSYNSYFDKYICSSCGEYIPAEQSVFEKIKMMQDIELAAFLEDKFKPENMTYDDILSWIRGQSHE